MTPKEVVLEELERKIISCFKEHLEYSNNPRQSYEAVKARVVLALTAIRPREKE